MGGLRAGLLVMCWLGLTNCGLVWVGLYGLAVGSGLLVTCWPGLAMCGLVWVDLCVYLAGGWPLVWVACYVLAWAG